MIQRTDMYFGLWGKHVERVKPSSKSMLDLCLGEEELLLVVLISNVIPQVYALSKRPLSTTDIFLFNIGKSKKKFEDVNYELLEDLKDGDAFASKYNSQELKIRVPNVVVVFSNEYPNTKELARDRWKVFSIEIDELVERQVMKIGQSDTFLTKKKKVFKTSECNSDSDDY